MISAAVSTPVSPVILAFGMDWTPDRIKALRKRLGYNQTQMARALGYTHASRVSELENGVVKPTDTIRLLLEHLDRHGDLTRREKD